ncbi:ROK family transcriptional regulator (plasmid) [Coraliomargarita sp. W4R53]
MRRGSNLPAVGTYNHTLVLDLIRRSAEGMSRVELAERTGLSSQTLTNVTRRLVEEGFVVEAGKVISGPGKPRTLLALNPRSRFAVGVHLDPFVSTFVVVDAAGDVIAQSERAPLKDVDQDALIADVASAVRDLIDKAGVEVACVLGIGLASPGPIDAATGSLLAPPLLPEWHHVRVRELLSQSTGLPVIVEKDVTAAMVGELWVDNDEELSNAMFVYYGAGVGLGLAVAGAPLRGITSNAGNIGHLVTDPGGPLCSCGTRGCLGVSIDPVHLLEQADLSPVHGALTGPLLDRLCRMAGEGDYAAERILTATAARLARAVVQVNNLLDLEAVVVGGPTWARLAPYLAPRLKANLAHDPASTSTQSLRLQESRLGTDVAAVGAACLLLDLAFTARPSALMIEG